MAPNKRYQWRSLPSVRPPLNLGVGQRNMPKRTNDFQKLIKSVYDQIVPDGGKVTESGMVFDKGANELREVDILVEYRYAHHDFKIVIECRDRSRKESVEWIDNLIGKNKSLSVNKVVAVSKSGFTKNAKNKAKANDIDTLTLEEAIDTDWSNFLFKPGIVIITSENFRLHDVLYKKNDKYHSLKELDLQSSVEKNGEDCGSIKENIELFFNNQLLPFIQTKKRKEIIELFKTRADLDTDIYIESDHPFPGFCVRLSSGEEIDISILKFIIFGTFSTEEVDQKHYKFNQLMVSAGEHLDGDGTKIKINIVQDPESKKIHGRWQRVPPDNT